MTVKHNKDNGLQTRLTRPLAGETVLPQFAVTSQIEFEYTYQTFLQGDNEVPRNLPLRQALNRYNF